MKIIIVAGTAGAGKTAIIRHAIAQLTTKGIRSCISVLSLSAKREQRYTALGVPVNYHCVGTMCPDHETMMVFGQVWVWAQQQKAEVLIIETAGLCLRCSPYLSRAAAVAVVSGLSNIGHQLKLSALITAADVLVLTKAELLSHAERQLLLNNLKTINPHGTVLYGNGLTGEGTNELVQMIEHLQDITLTDYEFLRYTLPKGYCHFCQGKGSGHE